MIIIKKEIAIKKLLEKYKDEGELGVVAYQGQLQVRPSYQREFVYDLSAQQAVIETIINDHPLNLFYFSVNSDGSFDLLDGQQRLLSICHFSEGKFSMKSKQLFFDNFSEEMREHFLDYKITVYFCHGTENEKLEGFQVINTYGKKLNDQELRNAIYCGPGVTDARKYFSKRNCPAYQLASHLLKGSPINQDYLETVLKGYANHFTNYNIDKLMSMNRNYGSAYGLRMYFEEVVKGVTNLFPLKEGDEGYKLMKGIDGGFLYDEYHEKKKVKYNVKKIQKALPALFADYEITKPKGIFKYIITGDDKYLNIRTFSMVTKKKILAKQNSLCAICKAKVKLKECEGDHIIPGSQGGKTDEGNCQILCKLCHIQKTSNMIRSKEKVKNIFAI